jgi:hypothetical protein
MKNYVWSLHTIILTAHARFTFGCGILYKAQDIHASMKNLKNVLNHSHGKMCGHGKAKYFSKPWKNLIFTFILKYCSG